MQHFNQSGKRGWAKRIENKIRDLFKVKLYTGCPKMKDKQKRAIKH